jgi:Tfp pilus assembly protein PilF
MRQACFVLVMTLGVLSGAQARGQGTPHETVTDQARALLSLGQAAQAIPLLKEEIERDPSSMTLRLLLARAYLDDGNELWALRTVAAAADLHREDCNLSLWLAWIQIRQGALDQAREVLDGACSHWQPERARRALLMAMLAQQAGSPAEAQARLDEALAADLVYPEDRAAIGQLQDKLDPGHLPPITGRLEAGLGWAANALAGSPTDPISAKEAKASPVGQTAVWVRFLPPSRSWVRPSLEADMRALGYSAATGRDFSYLSLGARPGVQLGKGKHKALLAYHYESLLLAGGDRYVGGPLWFYDSHRAEGELEIPLGLMVFGGVGKRNFREMGRNRLEADGGMGGTLDVGTRTHLLGAVSGRYQDAANDAYDLRGASLLVAAEIRLPRRWSARAGVLASGDLYPRSAGYFDPAAHFTNRRDVLIKLSASTFAPPLGDQVKLGLFYEFANRDSTAHPYAYTDHRVLAKLIWNFTADPWLPAAVSPVDHVAIDYGLGAMELGERVQDLLRQNEDVQRSASCHD